MASNPKKVLKSTLKFFLNMKVAPNNFRPWLKETHSNKLSDDIKKILLTSKRKVTEFLVESDQNFYFKVRPYRKFVKVIL